MILQVQVDPLSTSWALNGSLYIVGALLLLIASIVGWVFITTLGAYKEELINIHRKIDDHVDEHLKLKDKHDELRIDVVKLSAEKKLATYEIADVIVRKLRSEGIDG